jgi:hypothetical protein
MYYKDKKKPLPKTSAHFLINMHLLKVYYTKLIPADYRRCLLGVLAFIVLIYFYKLTSYVYVLTSSDTIAVIDETQAFNSIIEIQKPKDPEASSIIISALIKSDGGDENLADRPIYSLVKPFGSNGIYLYDMKEPIESWWPFDCIQTQMKQSINTKLCIHDPKFDKYVRYEMISSHYYKKQDIDGFLVKNLDLDSNL